MGDPCDPETGGQVMKFVVNKPLSGKDSSRVPRFLRTVEKLEPEKARVTRDMAIIEYASSDTDEPIGALLNGRMWDHPVLAEPKLGSTEIWNIINTTMDAHPIHLHLVRFQILDRQPINPDLYMADWGAMEFGMGPDPIKLKPSHILGPRYQPEANEKGWKDTIKVYPGEVTRVIAKFDDYTGIYAWHCHILEHEDNEMMLQYRVVP
jgi:spore coat protein A